MMLISSNCITLFHCCRPSLLLFLTIFPAIKINVGLDRLAERHKSLRTRRYAKADERGITIPEFLQINKRCAAWQGAGLYVSSISTNAYFNSIWPSTTRELRDAAL